MSVAIIWGWYGVGGAAMMGGVGALLLYGIVIHRHDPSLRGPVAGRLVTGGVAILILVSSVFFIGAGVARFWGALHERRTQFTVQALSLNTTNGVTSYTVNDTEGNSFTAEFETYQALEKGDDVECRVAPVQLGPDLLISCEPHRR